MHVPRPALAADLPAVGRLLHDFNTEFGDPSPGPDQLSARCAELIEDGDTSILVVGTPPSAVAVIRYRRAVWSPGNEAYLAELYVVPALRGQGIGTALMAAVVDDARARQCEELSIAVDESDHGARRFYERLGFTNRSSSGLMYYYEQQL